MTISALVSPYILMVYNLYLHCNIVATKYGSDRGDLSVNVLTALEINLATMFTSEVTGKIGEEQCSQVPLHHYFKYTVADIVTLTRHLKAGKQTIITQTHSYSINNSDNLNISCTFQDII